MKVGILALQGDFAEHERMLATLNVETMQIRSSNQLAKIDALIIPGGESTTIGKLAVDFHLLDDLKQFAQNHVVWGTCAGAIFLSKNSHHPQPLLQLMDINTTRNAFGRQVESFEINLPVPVFAEHDGKNPPFPAIFIRAPLIDEVGDGVDVLARLPNSQVVAARQGKWLATSFHPELTDDNRFHRYFLEMIPSK